MSGPALDSTDDPLAGATDDPGRGETACESLAITETSMIEDRGPLAPVQPQFRALAEAFVPGVRSLGAGGWADLVGVVEGALEDRPPEIRRQLLLLVRLLDWLPVVRYGRRLRALGPDRRRSVLARLQEAPILAVRRGVWGLRTLAFMGYYGRPESHREIGYRAHPDGWDARDRPAPWGRQG